MNKTFGSEENLRELIVSAKIISSILFGLMCGLLAYLGFNGIVFAVAAALLTGGLLVGTFFAPNEHRKRLASVICIFVFGATIIAGMMRIESGYYASFFGYLAGFACALAVVAMVVIVGIATQASNSDDTTNKDGERTAFIFLCTFVLSLAVWFTCSVIAQSFHSNKLTQLAVVTTEIEQEAIQKKNSAEVRNAVAAAEEIREAKRQAANEEREIQNAKLDETIKKEREIQIAKQEAFERVRIQAEKQKRELREFLIGRAAQFELELKQNRVYSAYIEGVRYSDELQAVLIIVRNNWHIEPYQIRLQATQNLGKMWKDCARIPTNSAAAFFIGDINGNEVGGTGIFGVYAQKE